MSTLDHLLQRNREWSDRISKERPEFFAELAEEQHPEFVWIGCSDSRVPASEIVDVMPGNLFVHRNIANVVVHTDMNCMSVLQYAVEALGVRHIIVCGHYGCGGVKAAMGHGQMGLIDNWLRHIKDVYQAHEAELAAIEDEQQRFDRLCELNTAAQAANVAHTAVVQNAWARGQPLSVHGWIYGMHDGHLHDLGVDVSCPDELDAIHRLRARG